MAAHGLVGWRRIFERYAGPIHPSASFANVCNQIRQRGWDVKQSDSVYHSLLAMEAYTLPLIAEQTMEHPLTPEERQAWLVLIS